MVAIGEHNGRRTAALITDMDVPLGHLVGNSLEVQEAAETLMGKALRTFIGVQGSGVEYSCAGGGQGHRRAVRAMVEQALASGAALEKIVPDGAGAGRRCRLYPRPAHAAACEI